MKWPNLAKVDNILKERDPDGKALEDRSSDTMSYFTGMILPGKTLPWLLMNTLVDCDDDVGPNLLAALTHASVSFFLFIISRALPDNMELDLPRFRPHCPMISPWRLEMQNIPYFKIRVLN